MSRFVLACLFIAATSFISTANSAMIAQPDIGKVVTFIFTADKNGDLNRDSKNNPIPYGTGLFVLIQNEAGGSGGHGYLVTDKHVLKDQQGTPFSRIFIRVNKLSGDAEFDALDLVSNGQSVVYTHPDHTVDIAVIPAIPDPTIYDLKTVPAEWLATKDLPGIGEGADVFFVGLFTTYYGERQNVPLFRFGRIAMLPADRISWQDKQDAPPDAVELYLLQTQIASGRCLPSGCRPPCWTNELLHQRG
jgi:hypothetical protein